MTTALIIIQIILQITDGVLTYKALSLRGAAEGNLIMKKAFNAIGILPTLLLLKGGIIGALFYATSRVQSDNILLLALLVVLNAFYVWVVWNNINIIKKLKE